MQKRTRNPFKFGKEVSGYQFYDRVDDVKLLERKLVEGGVVERNAAGYRLADPFFARYLNSSPMKIFDS